MAHKLNRAERIKLLAMEMADLKPFSHGEIDILRRQLWPFKPGDFRGPEGNSSIPLDAVGSAAGDKNPRVLPDANG